MTPDRKVLVGEGLGGVGILASGLTTLGTNVGVTDAVIVAAVTAVAASAMYHVDRGRFDDLGDGTLAAAVLGLTAVGAVLLLSSVTVGVRIGPPAVGLGLGILCNRVAFGVLNPVPARRLARVSDGSV